MVLVGAEGVVENGGVINKLGTYQLSLCAHAHGIPFYVAAESYKVELRCNALSDMSCSLGLSIETLKQILSNHGVSFHVLR